jgi:hypothetical protein
MAEQENDTGSENMGKKFDRYRTRVRYRYPMGGGLVTRNDYFTFHHFRTGLN